VPRVGISTRRVNRRSRASASVRLGHLWLTFHVSQNLDPMNTTLRILLGWLAVSLGIVLMIIGHGPWVLLAAVLLDMVLRHVVRPRIPYGWHGRSSLLALPLMLVFLFAIIASGSEVTSIRNSAWFVVGGIILWCMYGDMRLRKQVVHDHIG
jgi:hypothetical protein